MEKYKYNGGWGTHTIRTDFQSGEYKGHVSYEVGGNSNGLDLLEGVDDNLIWARKFKQNTCSFKVYEDEEWFGMVLKDKEGNELIIEDECDDLGSYIVGVSIVDYVKESRED